MKKKILLLSVSSLIILWYLFAYINHIEVIVPYPHSILSCMIEQLQSTSFYYHLIATMVRSGIGFLVAFSCSFILSSISFFYPKFKIFFQPWMTIMKSIPNVTYIIILLIWVKGEGSVMVVNFFILFPMMYITMLQGFESMDAHLLDILKLYPSNKLHELRHVYIPNTLSYITSAISSGLGLCLKVGVMAEILGQVKPGIGSQLNYARSNLDMVSIFAWSVWIILILVVFEFIFKRFKKVK